ncbi:hypothetical protein [Bordetella genomosp. 9]|uniref:Uncharacterized protein n=1 Tax=Bordetella genomosp. 9 TaxID=1416803 RepID=A0A1W6YYF9_9BORD|nr:hypothetical protein [Bordetella genomosp. 9]ARP85643.1 hypothetical protein CAL13_05040 [Bordetella genomosp. 9]
MNLDNFGLDNLTSQLNTDEDAVDASVQDISGKPSPALPDLYAFQKAITKLSVKSTVVTNYVKSMGDMLKTIARNIVP